MIVPIQEAPKVRMSTVSASEPRSLSNHSNLSEVGISEQDFSYLRTSFQCEDCQTTEMLAVEQTSFHLLTLSKPVMR